jgi:hypothetical protein
MLLMGQPRHFERVAASKVRPLDLPGVENQDFRFEGISKSNLPGNSRIMFKGWQARLL